MNDHVRYLVKARGGAIVREGAELTSGRVRELQRGDTVLADLATAQVGLVSSEETMNLRVHIARPVEGWVSMKCVEPYGTAHATSPRQQAAEGKQAVEGKRRIAVGVKQQLGDRSVASEVERQVARGDFAKARGRVVEELKASPRDSELRSLLAKVDLAETEAKVKALSSMTEAERADHETLLLKTRADADFGARNWRSAALAYTALLEAMAHGAVVRLVDGERCEAPKRAFDAQVASRLHANRSACFGKMRRWLDAKADALAATELQPEWPKAWARLCRASLELEEPSLEFAKRAQSTVLFREVEACIAKTESVKMRNNDLDVGFVAPPGRMVDPMEPPAEIKLALSKKRRDERKMRKALLLMTPKQLARREKLKAGRQKGLTASDESSSDDSEISMSSEEEDEEQRKTREEARFAAFKEQEADLKRTVDGLCSSAYGNVLDKATREGAVVLSRDGLRLRQSVNKRGTILAKDPLTAESSTWCIVLEEVGTPLIGIVGLNAYWITLYSGRHAIAKRRNEEPLEDCLDHHNRQIPPFKKGDCLGFALDSNKLYFFVNGKAMGAIFEVEEAEMRVAVGFDASISVGKCRVVFGHVDDPDRLAKDAMLKKFKEGRGFSGKKFRLTDESGKRHARMDQPKRAWCMVEVHEGNGGVDAVWCETDQARWTQSVTKVDVLILGKPSEVAAADCDVKITSRYLKASHRATGRVWAEGRLAGDVLASESLWFVDDAGLLQVVLAKCLAAIQGGHVSAGNWSRLFEFDDELSDGDMDHDRTDVDVERKRADRLAALRAKQDAHLDIAKRQLCEDKGEAWAWHQHSNGAPIMPSYTVPGQIGYDTRIDTDLALRDAHPNLRLGA